MRSLILKVAMFLTLIYFTVRWAKIIATILLCMTPYKQVNIQKSMGKLPRSKFVSGMSQKQRGFLI